MRMRSVFEIILLGIGSRESGIVCWGDPFGLNIVCSFYLVFWLDGVFLCLAWRVALTVRFFETALFL